MTKVKICGITNSEDALKAASLGAWAVGFIFYKKSARSIGAYKAAKIIDRLPPFVTPVGVFVNQKEGAVKEILSFCGIRTVQFHGDESPAFCQRFNKFKVIKAFGVKKKIDISEVKKFDVDAFLFDTYQEGAPGGTGKTFNWSWMKGAKSLGRPVILSGGLNSANVNEAIEEVRPFAVDVASGVEQSPGKKSERSMKDFFAALEFQKESGTD